MEAVITMASKPAIDIVNNLVYQSVQSIWKLTLVLSERRLRGKRLS